MKERPDSQKYRAPRQFPTDLGMSEKQATDLGDG